MRRCGARRRVLPQERKPWRYEFGDSISSFEMPIAGQYERIDPRVDVFAHSRRDCVGITDKLGAQA